MLLETIADALLCSHPLEDATVDAAVFAGRESLGGEVVDARGEAVLYETAKGLLKAEKIALVCAREVPIGRRKKDNGRRGETYAHELFDLALLHALLELALFGL